MKKLRLSARRFGWVGATSLVLGIATLAFSQLTTGPEAPSGDAASQVASVRQRLEALNGKLDAMSQARAGIKQQAAFQAVSLKLKQAENGLPALGQGQAAVSDDVRSIASEVARVEADLAARHEAVARSMVALEEPLEETQGIFEEAVENAGGNLEEILPVLQVVAESLTRAETEVNAVSQLVDAALSDGSRQAGALSARADGVLDTVAAATAAADAAAASNASEKSREVSEAFSGVGTGGGDNRFTPGIRSDGADIGAARDAAAARANSEETIEELRARLASSQNVQSALSEDTEKLQTDLQIAFRKITSLEKSKQEAERMIEELEASRNSLLRARGQNEAGVDAVNAMVTRLQEDLKKSHDDLRLSRQALLVEQERSTTMIRTLSSELDRTRKELDSARVAANATGADATRLLTLEAELDNTKKALQQALAKPATGGDPAVEANLRDELRKALGDVARLQAELSGQEELEEQLRNMQETIKELSERPGNPDGSAAEIAALIQDLNEAKRSVVEAKAESEELRAQLAEKIETLQGNLGQSGVSLQEARANLDAAREAMAKKEIEYATHIHRLDAELQAAQRALQDATQGVVRQTPGVQDMSRDLDEYQARIDALTKRFDEEQAGAQNLLTELGIELEATKQRHLETLKELEQKEQELQGQSELLSRARQEADAAKKDLRDVQMIQTQLEELNKVLVDTKGAQGEHVTNAGRIIEQLRADRDQARVELVIAKEAKEKSEGDYAARVAALELELENARNQLLTEQSSGRDRTAESAIIIGDLKRELDITRKEMARLRNAGAGDAVATEQLAAQLQEALGQIRILQENLAESENVGGQVDSLRGELSQAMQTHLADIERGRLEKERLQAKVADLEVEVKVLTDEGAGQTVKYRQALARMAEQVKTSQDRVDQLETAIAQSETTGVGVITELEEQLEKERGRNSELEANAQKAMQGKQELIGLLEKELALTKQTLDELQVRHGADAPAIGSLEQRLLAAKTEVDEMARQRDEALEQASLAKSLEDQLTQVRQQLLALEDVEPGGDAGGDAADLARFARLEDELGKAQNKVNDLNAALQAKEAQRVGLEDQLAQAIRELETAQEAGMETANLRKQLEDLRTRLAVLRPDPAVSPDTDLRVAELKTKVEALEVELAVAKEQLLQGTPPDTSGLAAQVSDLRTQLQVKELQRSQLEDQLVDAKRQLAQGEGGTSAPDTGDVAALRARIAALQKAFDEKELERVLLEEKYEKLAQDGAGSVSPSANDEKLAALQLEINNLKADLKAARSVPPPPPVVPTPSPEADNLRSQLAEKSVEIIDLQAELEETRQRLAGAQVPAPGPSSFPPSFNDEKLAALQLEINNLKADLKAARSVPPSPPESSSEEVANLTERLAESEKKVENLNAALAASQGMRMELEQLQRELAGYSEGGNPEVAGRIATLQNEVTRLKSDLTQARDNEEEFIRTSMADYAKLKESVSDLNSQVATLKNENDRLRTAQDRPSPQMRLLQDERDRVAKENTALRLDLQNAERRYQSTLASMRSAPSTDETALRNRILQAESDLETAVSAEQKARRDYQLADDERKNANRRLITMDENLKAAQRRIAELEALALRAGSVPSPTVGPRPSSPTDLVVQQGLRDEVARLQRELVEAKAAAQPTAPPLDSDANRLRYKNQDLNRQLLAERRRIEGLQAQLTSAQRVKREDLERSRASEEMISRLNQQLEKANSDRSRLVAAVRAQQELLKGGTGAGGTMARVPSSPNTGSSFGGGIGRPAPRPAALPFPTFTPRGGGSGLLPRTALPPRGNTVERGTGGLDLSAIVQFLNNKNKPAVDTEFFVLREDLNSVVRRAGIRLPVEKGINSASELWARSVRNGYIYPGVAAHIRNALAQAPVAYLKTDARGQAAVRSLPSGSYYLVGTAPLGRVGVVWSKPFQVEAGRSTSLALDLQDADWAK